MSATLYALIVVQGTTLSISPGYTSLAECTQQYTGPHVACFSYDPKGTSWSAFFKLADGALRRVTKIPYEGECQRYIAAFKSDVPTACRQLAVPNPDPCPIACKAPVEPTPPSSPPAAKPEAPVAPQERETTPKPGPANIQVNATRVTEAKRPNSFANVSVGPTALKDADKPYIEPRPAARIRTATQRYRQRRQPQFDPFGEIIAMFVPGRDW